MRIPSSLEQLANTNIGAGLLGAAALVLAIRLVVPSDGGLAPAHERGGGMIPEDELTEEEREKYNLT